jgi:hypothetical protein
MCVLAGLCPCLQKASARWKEESFGPGTGPLCIGPRASVMASAEARPLLGGQPSDPPSTLSLSMYMYICMIYIYIYMIYMFICICIYMYVCMYDICMIYVCMHDLPSTLYRAGTFTTTTSLARCRPTTPAITASRCTTTPGCAALSSRVIPSSSASTRACVSLRARALGARHACSRAHCETPNARLWPLACVPQRRTAATAASSPTWPR